MQLTVAARRLPLLLLALEARLCGGFSRASGNIQKHQKSDATIDAVDMSVDALIDGDAPLALCSVTLGLEDLALKYIVSRGVCRSEDLAMLPTPPGEKTGEGCLAQFLVRVDEESLARLQAAPVLQSVMAFVGYATLASEFFGEFAPSEEHDGALQPTDGLHEIFEIVRDSRHWSRAVDLLGTTPTSFRASSVAATSFASGDSEIAMAMGGGVIQSRGWKVSLYEYDTELVGFLWGGRFTCGVVLGGEWRKNMQRKNFKFSVAPFCEAKSRPYLVQEEAADEQTPWYMPKLRPSTALLLLMLAETRDGDVVLDPMGGSGTIAIEAAANFDVRATTGDKDHAVASAAVRAVVRARPFLKGSCMARDLDATKLTSFESQSIDRFVTDTPFGHRCRWDIRRELPLLLDEISRLLSKNGRAVLLMKGFRRTEDILRDEPERYSRITVVETRDINIGGFRCSAIVIKPVSD